MLRTEAILVLVKRRDISWLCRRLIVTLSWGHCEVIVGSRRLSCVRGTRYMIYCMYVNNPLYFPYPPLFMHPPIATLTYPGHRLMSSRFPVHYDVITRASLRQPTLQEHTQIHIYKCTHTFMHSLPQTNFQH